MPAVTQARVYPAAMDQKLRQVCRRQLTIITVRALLLSGSVLLAAMFVSMVVDECFTLFNTTARALLTFSAILATAATLLVSCLGPILAAFGLRRAADKVDQATPELEERWSTVANLVESKHRPRSTIGRAMLRQVTSEAIAMERLVEPARVVKLRDLRRAIIAFAAVALLTVLFLAANWQYHGVLLHRFWSPLSNIAATELECLSGDLIVPRGEPVELVVRMAGFMRDQAILEMTLDDADQQAIALTPTEHQPDQFRYNLAALESTFRYRVHAGDGRTQWHTVTAVDRPSLAEVKMTLTAPEYVDRPVYEKDYLPAQVQVVQGSSLLLQIRPNTELKSFRLRVQRDDRRKGQSAEATTFPTILLTREPDGWYRYESVLEEDVTITPDLLSLHGLKMEDPQKCIIRVIPDRAPIARVISPTKEMAASPNEVVEVKFEAHDDHGIAKAELVVYKEAPVEGEPPSILSVEEIPLGDQHNAPHVLAAAKLDLSKFDLQKGSCISYAIRVTDNRIAMGDQGSKNQSAPSQTIPTGETETQLDKESGEVSQARPQPDAAKEIGSSGKNSTPGEVTSRSTEAEPPATDLLANTELKQESPGPSTDDQTASNDSLTTKEGALFDAELAKSSNNSAASTESTVPDDSRPGSTSATQNAVAAAGNDAKSESTVDVDSHAESDSHPPATDNKSEMAQPQTGALAAPLPSGEPLPPGGRAVPDDLTPVNPRPTVTDDFKGQFSESNRMQLKIEEKLSSAELATETDRETIQIKVRQRLEEIDRQLKTAEEGLSSLVATTSQSGIADPQIKTLQGIDEGLAHVEETIASLRKESKETPYAFAGLHMVDVGMAYVTPARDRVFSLIRQPDVDHRSNVEEAWHRVSRARELLAELLVRYERVLREERLANSIQETAKIYEVYVSNLHRFLRAQSKPNPNPLQRKMAIVEVDQDYLDRLRQVAEMRRDLMAEFGRMLGDDPRLLSKYMDLLKRRQTSLRDQLTELRERQDAIATELSGWLRVAEAQRDDVWILTAEVRLQEIAPLVQEASQLEERTTSQFPLSLNPAAKNSVSVFNHAKHLAVSARSAAAKARRLLQDPTSDQVDLESEMDQLVYWLAELDAALEQLAFDNPSEEATDFTNKRLAECRGLFERLVGSTETASHLQARRFDGILKVDQQQLAFRTELLRIEMEGIDEQLSTEFQNSVPESVTALATELKQLMEGITFNQVAATFELESKRLGEAETQQSLAQDGFKRAEQLFDQIRRKVIEELDRIDPPDPNIADLEDPTLDQLLARLEREPNLNALLGLPNRPQNLRVISDFVTAFDGNQSVPLALEQAAEQARRRAKEEEQEARRMQREPAQNDDKTEEEWRQMADAGEAQAKLQEKIDDLKRRAENPIVESEEADKLRQMAQQLEQLKVQLATHLIDQRQWEEMSRSDQLQAILRAAARGEPLPDTQWNRLISSLDEGLWQVRRRTPPEEFRQAIEQYQERIRKLNNLETVHDLP